LPTYIGGRSDGAQVPLGTNRSIVSLYVTKGAKLTGATVDGKAVPIVLGTERARPVFDVNDDWGPGQKRTIIYEYTEPRSKDALTVPVQPMARPMTVRIDNTCP
jgi:hypothetical protein